MRAEAVLMTLLWVFTSAGAIAGDVPTSDGLVELPLAEVLRLYRADEAADREQADEPPPPLASALDRIELTGRLDRDHLDVTGKARVTVLDDTQWVRVPLVRLDDHLALTRLAETPDGVLTVAGGWLSLVTRSAGAHEIELSFRVEAEPVESARRIASFRVGVATLSRLAVMHDTASIRLLGGVVEQPDGRVVLLPSDGEFVARWETTGDDEAQAEVVEAMPEIESVVQRAHASTVTTLEGRRVTRLACRLRFQGSKPVRFSIPEGQDVEQAYVNGALVPFVLDEGEVELLAKPARVGELGGTVEIVLTSRDGSYPLSGTLTFELPRVSWTVHELWWDLHLPEVFNYRWTGGSLEPAPESPSARYSYSLPMAGKRLSFRQLLIARSEPRLTIDYAIDLEGHYHCGT